MPQAPDAVFYQAYFQEPGRAESELEHDVRASIRSIVLSVAGEAPMGPDGDPAADNFSMVPRAGGLLGRIMKDARNSAPLPPWLTETDLDFYAGEFSRAGFRGGLNWYRNIDRNWELLAPFAGARVTVPALYTVGERDLVLGFRGVRDLVARLSQWIPQLRQAVVLPGCGHWTQQERSKEVNELMIAFMTSLET
jgi:pimeloyl-ACP methyl ester carboxylesterase